MVGARISLPCLNMGRASTLIVLGNQWWRLFTAQFVHIGILHLASNAVIIYYVGSILEPMIGPWRFFKRVLVKWCWWEFA